MNGYVYQSFERGLWTVGFYDPSGKWHAESDHGSTDEAAKRVHYLNGGSEPQPEAERSERLADAEYQASRWVADAADWEGRAYALRHALDNAVTVLDDIAAEDRNGYSGQRARGALKSARKALEEAPAANH